MATYIKPKILLSKCLTDAVCRYDGQKCTEQFIESLSEFADFILVCPERGMGMEVPRQPLRLVKDGELIRLMQLSTALDYTDKMQSFTDSFIPSDIDIDGAIFKSKSPSCGISGVKVYKDILKGASIAKDKGLFASFILEKYNAYPIEDEGRLKNFRIREKFLTVVFTYSEFKSIKKKNDIDVLMDFHSKNRLLFMAYNQIKQKELDEIIDKHEKKDIKLLFCEYELILLKLLDKMPRYTSNAKVMMHTLGHFLNDISINEKEYILKLIEEYNQGEVPLSVPLSVLKYNAIRFNNNYLLNQTFLEPYPKELVTITDSGKGIAK